MNSKLCYIVILLTLSSCFVVRHKKNVLNAGERGNKFGVIKLDGYYFREYEEQAFPFYKNEYNGYTEDTSAPYLQKRIEPIILNANGTIRTFRYQSGLQENLGLNFDQTCGLLDQNTIESAIEHFECELNNDDDRYPIWGKGVFRSDQDSILIQYYVNWIGDYYLKEQKGAILNDSTFILTEQYDYKLDSTYQIQEVYKFRKFKNKPDSTNYITKHPKRFGRRNKS